MIPQLTNVILIYGDFIPIAQPGDGVSSNEIDELLSEISLLQPLWVQAGMGLHDMETRSALLVLFEENNSQKVSNAKLWCFPSILARTTIERTVNLLIIWEAMAFMWRHCNDANDLLILSVF